MRFGLIISLIVGLAFSLVGCGGGGGPSGPTFRYSTNWSQAGVTGPDGLSQRIRLLNLDDTDAVNPVILAKSSPTTTTTFAGFAPGTYRLRVELRSLANGTGSINGVCERLLTISSATAMGTDVGTNAITMHVGPASAAIETPGSVRYVATAFDASNQGVFLPEGAFAWGVTGPATVTTDGIVVPMGAGNGAATATLGGLDASGDYSATAGTPTTTKWTVMVYMNAANNLEAFSLPNINQMELIADNPDVRFVVQWKEAEVLNNGSLFNGTKRYLVKHDTTPTLASQLVQDMGSGVDMGDKQTLRDFIAWTKANYPAQRYCVVVWNHGNGWRQFIAQQADYPTRGVSYDDETGHGIATADIPYALGPDQLDIVAWDASLMQMLEVAYQIRNQAQYVVGSEESPPAEGFPYDLVFKPMHDNPDATTRDLTKGFIDGMLAVPGYHTKKITESSIETAQLPALATALDTLALDLILNSGSFPAAIQLARNTAQSYLPLGGRVYRDLYDLCVKLVAGSGVAPSTITACQNVRAAVLNALAWEGHNSNSANSHGISIDFSSSAQYPAHGTEYDGLSLSGATNWNEWLSQAP